MRAFLRLLVLAVLAVPCLAQVQHEFPAKDTDNVMTGKNQFTVGTQLGPVTFATLNASAPPNGTVISCSDCAVQNPCVGSGSGAIAHRVGGVWNCSLGSGGALSQVGPRPSIANWHYLNAILSGTADPVLTCGAVVPGTGVALKAVNASGFCGSTGWGTSGGSTTKPGNAFTTGTNTHAAAFLGQETTIPLTEFTSGVRTLTTFQASMFAQNNTAVRYWIGLWSGGTVISEGDLETDTPASFIGFRFSTNVPDTHWICYMRTTAVDSGVSISTTVNQILEMRNVPPNLVYYIDGSQVCSISLTGTGSQLFNPILWADSSVSGAAGGRSATFSWLYWEENP